MQRILLYILGGLIAVAMVLDVLAPEPVDWRLSFGHTSKTPFGCVILHDALPDLFPNQPQTVQELPLVHTLEGFPEVPTNYIFINQSFPRAEQRVSETPIADADMDVLLDFVAAGHTAFIAAHDFTGVLADTLRLEMRSHLTVFDVSDFSATTFDDSTAQAFYFQETPDSISINLAHPDLRTQAGYTYERQMVAYYFQAFDSTHTTVLGTNSAGKVNFMRTTFGAGAFYLSSVPLAFTNYNLLDQGDTEYVAKALSYLPVQPTYWDAYYKAERQLAQSPLRVVLSDEALRWAYYTALSTLLIFMVFGAKRRQRSIPVHTPPPNETLGFVRTVGRLYYQHRDHQNLAEKKITYFLEFVRNRLYITLPEFDPDWITRVAEKSGQDRADVATLVAHIQWIRAQVQMDEKALIKLDRQLQQFYTITKS